MAISLWCLVTATFFMIHLVPGDPVRAALGSSTPADVVAARTRALGLDRPLTDQYLSYLHDLFHGDLGTSILTGQPVTDTIRTQLPPTLQLAALAFAVTALVSLPLGVLLAVTTRGGRLRSVESSFTGISVLMLAVPSFLFAQGLVYVFSIQLGWFPIAGRSGVASYVLPTVALAAGPAPFFARIVRAEVLSVLDADFVRTARSKRLPGWRVLLFDVLPNSLTSTLTLGGLLLTGLVASTVFVEQVFSWPGLGSTLVSAIQGKDYPTVQGIVLVYGSAVLAVNFLVDLVLAAVDPRPSTKR
ncbi:ABC transporter permease [Streptomyces sp. NRRL F-5126]|uniref:ABC transporter permease n=1 Tax=Streptomyces sp. NRRL F-5126 TaxID=1463857 RepID=UPI001F2CC819|nr:ABC transporter permease [Streptomyces sp. NRRL F-5126]